MLKNCIRYGFLIILSFVTFIFILFYLIANTEPRIRFLETFYVTFNSRSVSAGGNLKTLNGDTLYPINSFKIFCWKEDMSCETKELEAMIPSATKVFNTDTTIYSGSTVYDIIKWEPEEIVAEYTLSLIHISEPTRRS